MRAYLRSHLASPPSQALLRQIPEYLELGEGVWYSIGERSDGTWLVFHVGAGDPDHALPARQHFRKDSASDGRAVEDAAFDRMRNTRGSLVDRFCKDQAATGQPSNPTSSWAEVMRRAGTELEPDTDDEDGEGEGNGLELVDEEDLDEEVDDEAHELGRECGAEEVEVAPDGPAAPLPILDPATIRGVWSDAANANANACH